MGEFLTGLIAASVSVAGTAIAGLVWLIRLESNGRHNSERIRRLEEQFAKGSDERRAADEDIRKLLSDLRTDVARLEGKVDAISRQQPGA